MFFFENGAAAVLPWAIVCLREGTKSTLADGLCISSYDLRIL